MVSCGQQTLYVERTMFQKLRVWCRLQNGQWELGQIQSTSEEKASVLLLDGNVSFLVLFIFLKLINDLKHFSQWMCLLIRWCHHRL